MNKLQTDVLVIGAGGAGIRAAIEASDKGVEVLLITKKKVGYSGSTFYPLSMPWGIMNSGNSDNSDEEFLNEILLNAKGVLNSKLAEIMVINSNDRVADLMNYGLKFYKCFDRGTKNCFSRKPTGFGLVNLENARDCLKNQIYERNIKVVEDLCITDLLVKENICWGAFGFDANNDFFIINAKTVVMATGGGEYLYKYNIVTSDITGDCYQMVAKHGARLTNLEFIQFVNALTSPKEKINFWQPSFKSAPKILNKNGEEFLSKYLPPGIDIDDFVIKRGSHGPFTTSRVTELFDIGIYKECKKEGNKNPIGAKVIYNESYFKKDDYETVVWIKWLTSIGIDLNKEDIKIYPHCQGFNGGIVINENCETDIANVYACGESAGGPHGADRIGGNGILASQVFGKIAGEQAAKRSKLIDRSNFIQISKDFILKTYDTGKESNFTSEEIIKNIKEIMTWNASIIRNENSLNKAIKNVKQMCEEFNPCKDIGEKRSLKKSMQAYNRLITASLILKSMFLRRESRGAHYREDYPKINNERFMKMNHIHLGEDGRITNKWV